MAKKLRRLFAALLSLTLILSGFNGITAHAALLSSDECSTHSDRGHFRWSGNISWSSGTKFYVGTYYDEYGVYENSLYGADEFASGKTPDNLPSNIWWYNSAGPGYMTLSPCTGHHTHTYAAAWSNDATNHWKASTCGHTSEKGSLAAHSWNSSTGKCSVCEYECLHTGEGGATCSKCGKTLHTHTWEYSTVGTDTIKATCNVDNHTTANDVTITISASDTAYTGSAIGASLSSTSVWSSNVASVPTIKYVGREGTTYSENTSAPTEVGKYTAKITVDTAEASVNYEITKANPALSPAPSAKTLTYSGAAQELVNAGTVANGTTYYRLGSDGAWETAIPSATDAGSYTVYYYVKGNTHYNNLGSEAAPHGSVDVTINGKAISATATGETVDYDGVAHKISISVTDPASGATVKYSTEENGTYSETNPEFTAVGTHTVYYRIECANYETKTGSANVVINGIDFGSSDITVDDYSDTYDGSSHGITVTVPAGATVTYSTESAGTYSETNPEFTDAGTYTVYYKVNKEGFNEASGSGTVTINPKAITATVEATNKTYDGTTAATVTASVTATDLIGDDCIVISGLTGSFADSAAGTGKTVTVDASGKSITGTGSSNYDVTIPASATATISKATPSLATAPSAIDDVISFKAGAADPLLNAGTTSHGTLQYKIGTAGTWNASIPTAAALQAGTYDIYYMIAGDGNHTDKQDAAWKITVKVEAGSVKVEKEDTITKGSTNVNATGASSGNLDKIPASNVEPGKDIVIKLEASAKSSSSDTASMEAAVEDAMGVAKASINKEYIDVTITKTVDGSSAPVTDTQTAVEVVFSYTIATNTAYMIIRNHNGNQVAFTQLASRPSTYADGTFYVDKANNKIYMYSRYFSEYMIGSVTGHTVTFNSNGGSAVEPMTVAKNVAVLPTPVKSGYTFAGWYEEETFTTPFTTSTELTDHITVYAKWVQNPSGGSNSGNNTTTTTSKETTVTVNITHTVVKGNTMFMIARKYGLTLAQLKALNPQIKNLNRIYPGQLINVGTETKTVSGADAELTGKNVSDRHETDYVVRKGDTLLKIARKNKMTLAEIAALNTAIRDLHWIYTGQVIKIYK